MQNLGPCESSGTAGIVSPCASGAVLVLSKSSVQVGFGFCSAASLSPGSVVKLVGLIFQVLIQVLKHTLTLTPG